jgi:hypothetical protein
MDPEYSGVPEFFNWTVDGSARLGEAGPVVISRGVSALPPAPILSPTVISSAGPRVLSLPDNATSLVSLGSFRGTSAPAMSSSMATSTTILDGIRALNKTVDGLLFKLHQQEQRLVTPPALQPPVIQPPVIQIFNGGSGVPEVYSSSSDPALAGGVAAAVLFVLFIIGALLLRRFFPNRWKTVRDAVVRALRVAAIPISWMLHKLGDLSHRFGSESGEDSVSILFFFIPLDSS